MNGIKIEQIENSTKITNDTKYYLWVSRVPVKPKRKYIDLIVINPGGYILYEYIIDLMKISFRLSEE